MALTTAPVQPVNDDDPLFAVVSHLGAALIGADAKDESPSAQHLRSAYRYALLAFSERQAHA